MAVSPEVKRELFRGSLFNCAPSRYEGWCIAAIEASAASKAVLGTRIPGLVDAVKEGETGILVEPDRPDALADAMIALHEDAPLRRSLGRAGRKWAERFTWDQVAREQEAAYLEAAAGTPRTTSAD